MKKLTLIVTLFGSLCYQSVLLSQSLEDKEMYKINSIGISIQTIYPYDIESPGLGIEMDYRHSLNKLLYYNIALGYGVVYRENEGGQQYTYATTTSTIDHYAHYCAKAALGIDILRLKKHRLGCSLGLAGRYSSTLHFKYAYHSMLENDHHEQYFIPEMIEGYDAGFQGEMNYSLLMNTKFELQFNVSYIAFGGFADFMSAGAGCFYRF
jgi:hypothetical protein